MGERGETEFEDAKRGGFDGLNEALEGGGTMRETRETIEDLLPFEDKITIGIVLFVGFVPIGDGIVTNGSQFFEGGTRGIFEIMKGMGIGGDEKGAGKVATKIIERHGMRIGRGGTMNVIELDIGLTGNFSGCGGARKEAMR